ncbi:hypothetical protein BEL04_21765 [Mucilaginibacter sp. PPCGB 2223]|nr:hypothetical protein BEL04_21765 [Mucilaginibacter sp. PPCGB 2223]
MRKDINRAAKISYNFPPGWRKSESPKVKKHLSDFRTENALGIAAPAGRAGIARPQATPLKK